MKLVDMAFTKAEIKEERAEMRPMKPSVPEYPYGLRIELSGDALEKLEMEDLPKVGTYFTVTAECCVVSVSSHTDADEDERNCVSLQIEKMALAPKSGGGGTKAKTVMSYAGSDEPED